MPEPYAADNQKLAPVADISPAPLNAAFSGANTTGPSTATITPPSDKFAYVTGFEITGLGATAAAQVTATLGALLGNVTFSYEIVVPAGVTTALPSLIVQFTKPVCGSAKGQAVTLSVPGFGAGNTNLNINLHGFAA